ncbi:MAG: 2-oxoglutarate dehydrogenase complex dihydrolipoyllysine-residue succinyltransferase [Verrucomicrobia bacterium]|nr:2-oxoglutarate dehydrogenase complex dihydrolipoyllysine-residue succinyltransferase [Kiritimatiellia bacterium]MCO6401510.1 2-oxoglutarate dehydrogenase complex dihydrolipoyllysine-residue succinyltransferase [Verrucomicrobiota bacterium]
MSAIEIKVPVFPESIQEGTLSAWHKKAGQRVEANEKIADIETDKIVLDVTAPTAGVLTEIRVQEGATVTREQVLGLLDPAAKPAATPVVPDPPPPAPAPAPAPAAKKTEPKSAPSRTPPAPAAPPPTPAKPAVSFPEDEYSPAVRRLIKEHNLNPKEITGHGKEGRITKADVLRHLEHSPHLSRQFGSDTPAVPEPEAAASAAAPQPAAAADNRPVTRVKMTRLRARVAERLVQAQQTAAILTTFNEINMQAVMELRARHKERFEREHGIKLGFMSFFVKATIEALARYPIVNASIEGDEIVYHQYFDLGIAVSAPRGLVVPVLRDAEQLSLAEIETAIADFGKRAQENKLALEDLSGGTFTISNGGVFGSLLSTPILNPPQSGILGMHRIQERPVVENGAIVIRPMMYVALSYDHRIIDGREAVQFLVALKEAIEDPARLLLQI